MYDMLSAGHEVMVTQPERLVEVLVKIANARS